jgi:hypothetical protein
MKQLTVFFVCLLFFAGTAEARQIARPEIIRSPYFKEISGERSGWLRAETRGGRRAGFLVLKQLEDWLLVRLGKRPNHHAVWLRKKDFHIVSTGYKIHISRKNRTMALFWRKKRLWKTSVIVGAPSTPTPRGLFALHDIYRVQDDLRPWVFETTAHSKVLDSFLGGPARIAIHGRHGSLKVPWGRAASNGCIRAPNWALRSLKRLVPIGAPIRVR